MRLNVYAVDYQVRAKAVNEQPGTPGPDKQMLVAAETPGYAVAAVEAEVGQPVVISHVGNVAQDVLFLVVAMLSPGALAIPAVDLPASLPAPKVSDVIPATEADKVKEEKTTRKGLKKKEDDAPKPAETIQ